MFNSQVCINDGAAPEYMKTIQAMNYIYKDKQECCGKAYFALCDCVRDGVSVV